MRKLGVLLKKRGEEKKFRLHNKEYDEPSLLVDVIVAHLFYYYVHCVRIYISTCTKEENFRKNTFGIFINTVIIFIIIAFIIITSVPWRSQLYYSVYYCFLSLLYHTYTLNAQCFPLFFPKKKIERIRR